MDYVKQPFIYKIRKILRYIRLYGFSRTYMKVKSQLHCKETLGFEENTWINVKSTNTGNVALVGCGNFSFSTIAYYLSKKTNAKIKYVLDIDKARARSLCKVYDGYKAVTEYQEILTDPDIKIIYIASNHASHAEYAIKAIQMGKHVHIEKPHAVSVEQLNLLFKTAKSYPASKIFLGFNRPQSTLFKRLQELLGRENGTAMLNWFVAGHEIAPDHWYFSEKEGGRVLGNLCHWSDLSLHIVGIDKAFPCTISPSLSGGDKSNFAVSVSFADGSQAGITFSAKGHTFDGVREFLNVHKGNLLASLEDFSHLKVDVVEHRKNYKLRFRDHGHSSNIVNSYQQSISKDGVGENLNYIYATALFVLKIKEAIDSSTMVVCDVNPQAISN